MNKSKTIVSVNSLSQAKELYARHLAGEKIVFEVTDKPEIPVTMIEAMAHNLAMLHYIGKIDVTSASGKVRKEAV